MDLIYTAKDIRRFQPGLKELIPQDDLFSGSNVPDTIEECKQLPVPEHIKWDRVPKVILNSPSTPYYHSQEDYISMPTEEASPYYLTWLYHELAHATAGTFGRGFGHMIVGIFPSPERAEEELIAESTSLLVATLTDTLTPEGKLYSRAYLQSWAGMGSYLNWDRIRNETKRATKLLLENVVL